MGESGGPSGTLVGLVGVVSQVDSAVLVGLEGLVGFSGPGGFDESVWLCGSGWFGVPNVSNSC